SEEENEKKETSGCHLSGRKTGDLQNISTEKPRNTARKSTTWKPRAITYTHVEKVHAPDLKSHLGYKDLHNLFSFTRVNYMVHVCGPQCREKDDPVKFKGFNPFLIPIYLGWERQLRRYKKGGAKLKILYRSPCGIHLRDLEEIVLYLKLVSSKITIDFFSMNPYLVVFRTFRAREMLFQIDDVTNGKENVPVSCVNSWENTSPPPVEYAAKRFAGPGVVLNEKKEFLVGCTCTDNCQDSERCECQRITNTTKIRKNSSGHLGYNHRRLKESVVTGVYECNSRCKCGPQCGNRVVQNGLQVRLQMFKTCRKGWGIRCLDDLDAGMFICIYAGQILTEQGADEVRLGLIYTI
ncbi:histone-lysine N-methyltransferase SETDB1-B, partial [Nephila pilipes]